MGRDFYDASFLMGKTKANLDYLAKKTGIGSMPELIEKMTARCGHLDLRSLAADVAPFVVKSGDTDRVLLFPEILADWRAGRPET